MAIYCYQCPECKDKVELTRTITERDDPVTCEKCGAAMGRLVSMVGIKVVGGTRKGYA